MKKKTGQNFNKMMSGLSGTSNQPASTSFKKTKMKGPTMDNINMDDPQSNPNANII